MADNDFESQSITAPGFSANQGLGFGTAASTMTWPQWLLDNSHLDPKYLQGSGASSGSSGEKSVEDYLREYDTIEPLDQQARQRANDLRGQSEAVLRPNADALSALLGKGEPAYQPAHVSPWLAALGAGLGAAQNAIEPYNQTGAQNWVANPLEQEQQSVQDAYLRARQSYASQLDNSQAQYGLAKDQSQTYLDRARQIEDDLREHAGRRAEYAARRILQDQNATQEQKLENLRQLHETELSRIQTEAQAKSQEMASRHATHQILAQRLFQLGDLAGGIKILQDDYLEGLPLKPDGSPVDPVHAAAVQHIAAIARNTQLPVLQRTVGNRISHLNTLHGKIYDYSARRQVQNLRRIVQLVAGQLIPLTTSGD